VTKDKKIKEREDSIDSISDEADLIETAEVNLVESSPPLLSSLAKHTGTCNTIQHFTTELSRGQAHETMWMLDSGTTYHVTGNPDLILGLQPMHHAPMLDAAGEAHPVRGKDKVFVQLPNGEIKCIDQVLYVPGIHRNLLSIRYIANQSYTLEFIKSTCLIRDMHTRQLSTHSKKCITH
jgi:hypothetical protein